MELVSQFLLPGHEGRRGDRTEIKGSRKRRVYNEAATPFARLKASPQADSLQLARLEKLLATLDPFALKQQIECKLRAILRHEVRRSFAHAAPAADC